MTRVVYLHGFASGPTSRKARFFGERLRAAGLAVDVPDLSEGGFAGLTISGQLAVIERVAAGDPVVLMGSSMGGYLAALYAARHPEVPRVVLLAPAFGFARRWPESLGEDGMRQWKEQGWREVFHYATGQPARIGYQLIEDGLRYEDFPEFRQPALIFHGLQDDVVPAAFSEEFAAGRTNVTLHLLESGHELTDVMEQVWTAAEPFLMGSPGRD
ncbi:MAG: alpha/beta fold hydrolase [Bryobacterales bacterium]|nr:alpha/beta fold hydrolase [Bryobacterales bacterium]